MANKLTLQEQAREVLRIAQEHGVALDALMVADDHVPRLRFPDEIRILASADPVNAVADKTIVHRIASLSGEIRAGNAGLLVAVVTTPVLPC